MTKPILIIPARLGSTRLKQKPLHVIGGKPLIAHVIERAKDAFNGPIVVACCDQRVFDIATYYGVQACLTNPDLPSGTDRVYDAFQKTAHHDDYDTVINLQGDMAVFEPSLIKQTLSVFDALEHIDIATAVTTVPASEATDHSTVKAIFVPNATQKDFGRIYYFSRSQIPFNAPFYYKHIGIYAYRKKALKDFIETPISVLEQQESLEQLRGLSLDFKFGGGLVEGEYLSVDTKEDVQKVEDYLMDSPKVSP